MRRRTTAAVREAAERTNHTLALAELASVWKTAKSKRAAAAAIALKYPGEKAPSLKRHLERLGGVLERTNQHQLLSDTQEHVILDVARTFSVANRALTRAQLVKLARYEAGKPKTWSGGPWYRSFMARHADHLQHARGQAMAPKRNRRELKGMVEDFIKRMKVFFESHTFAAEATWSADETLLSIHLSSQSPVHVEAVGKVNHNHVVPTGMHYGSLLLFSNAAGHTPLVVIVLPQLEQSSTRKKDPEFFLPDLQPKPSKQLTVLFAFTPSGRMVTSLFRAIMERFVGILQQRSPGVEQQLYLDRLGAHLDAIMVRHAFDNGLHVCWYPPDCSEFLQPCDDVMFASFKRELGDAVKRCDATRLLAQLPAHALVMSFLNTALEKCTAEHVVRRSFLNTGIFPFDPSRIRANAANYVDPAAAVAALPAAFPDTRQAERDSLLVLQESDALRLPRRVRVRAEPGKLYTAEDLLAAEEENEERRLKEAAEKAEASEAKKRQRGAKKLADEERKKHRAEEKSQTKKKRKMEEHEREERKKSFTCKACGLVCRCKSTAGETAWLWCSYCDDFCVCPYRRVCPHGEEVLRKHEIREQHRGKALLPGHHSSV
jgi:hypothetical protein